MNETEYNELAEHIEQNVTDDRFSFLEKSTAICPNCFEESNGKKQILMYVEQTGSQPDDIKLLVIGLR